MKPYAKHPFIKYESNKKAYNCPPVFSLFSCAHRNTCITTIWQNKLSVHVLTHIGFVSLANSQSQYFSVLVFLVFFFSSWQQVHKLTYRQPEWLAISKLRTALLIYLWFCFFSFFWFFLLFHLPKF